MPKKTDKKRPIEQRKSIFEVNHRQQALEVLKLAKQQENDRIRIQKESI